MKNKTEKNERDYLRFIKEKINKTIRSVDEKIDQYTRELKENKEYLYENKNGMDRMEKMSVRQSIDQTAMTGENAAEKKNRLQKLLFSPYFGRVDFKSKTDNTYKPVYIGVHSFLDEEKRQNLVHDWRAPISSLYYDFELGKANYDSPSGDVKGEITLKRQYRIREGEMEFMLENSANVFDDVLQEELSKTSDNKMKNIVATIQRDQNAVIRNEKSRSLIIQGVAGSGKTSIALHRIAFLLYRFKDEIQSKDILIISPNKVFADYISNVLPELGEDKIPETGMEEIAEKALEQKIKFQTFHQQLSVLLNTKNKDFIKRIQFKSNMAFLNRLDEYLLHIENNYFTPADLRINRNPIPAWFFEEKFATYHRLPVFKRFDAIAKDAEDNILLYYRREITAAERNQIRKEVRNMFKVNTLLALYKDFFEWTGHPEMFKKSGKYGYEYADVFPLVYLKIKLEGVENYRNVKHLLIDEMQDYTPVQYAVLSKMFSCKKTILGDAKQSVNPYSSVSGEDIQKVFPEADMVKLLKSYRSTYEITRFSQQILPNDELIPIERHGKPVEIETFASPNEEMKACANMAKVFEKSNHKTMGIICKTTAQAEVLQEYLEESGVQSRLLTAESTTFIDGISITLAYLAKGLEFDEVIIPFADSDNYADETDRGLLYIACTRAMHDLRLSCSKKPSVFLPPKE